MTRPSSDFAARRGRWRPTWWAGRARPTRPRRGAWAYRDPRRISAADRPAGRGFGRLPLRAGGGGRRCRADFRQLGREPRRTTSSSAGWSRRPRRMVARLKAQHPRGADHRISARRGRAGRRLCRRDGRRWRGLRYGNAAGVHGAASWRARRSCRAISIRCCWWRAGRRWSGALPKF